MKQRTTRRKPCVELVKCRLDGGHAAHLPEPVVPFLYIHSAVQFLLAGVTAELTHAATPIGHTAQLAGGQAPTMKQCTRAGGTG